MFKLIKPMRIKTITPMHCGVGQDLGIVDMPIQRERHTKFPKIEASSLKGALRQDFEKRNVDNVPILFGPEDGNEFASSIGFTDARILFFPVKSVKGIFALITCPQVLKKLIDDFDLADIENFKFDKSKIVCNDSSAQTYSRNLEIKKNILLEEYAFNCEEMMDENKKLIDMVCDKLGIKEEKDKIVILSDNDFSDFVNMSTEIITRTKIDNEKGVVVDGALFTEEYLPAETIMYTLVLTSDVYVNEKDNKGIKTSEDVMKHFVNKLSSYIQIGGNSTLGKGICSIKVGE